ncbi:hypothetical protein Pfo_000518 [Paulownia fortunei]|nr:hypothetical protein Pfo_000518 [Paulownia fortunei]
MDQNWIMNHNRAASKYINSLNNFLDVVKNYMSTFGFSKIRCPCRKCGNLYQFNLNYVRGHLYRWGISKLYKVWTFHGEVTTPSDDTNPVNEVEHVSVDEEDNTFFDMLNNLRDVEVVGSSGVRWEDNNENPSTEKLGEKLYSVCNNFFVFSFLVKLMHVKVLNGWSNKSFNMLFQLLREAFLKSNAIPSSYYKAKKMLRKLGLGYESIHTCKNDCILLWDEHESTDTRPTFLRYFPLKLRLKWLFLSKYIARDMRWHAEKRVETNRVLRHPADAKAWKEFDKSHKIFADDPKNVRLGLTTDGFNPFGNMSNPKAPEKKIDVYLHPLVNELKELWSEEIEAYDVTTERIFRLHVAVMWTINDFPAYGTISGWSTKGYNACHVCLEGTVSQRLGSKICYIGHRRFSHDKHSWRKNKSFNEKFESEGPPRTFSGSDILTQLDALPEVTFGKDPAVTNKRRQSVGDTSWVKKLIFFELEYLSDLKLRHNLDVIYIEKNICDALVVTLLSIDGKSKDIVKARLDRVSKPHASYIFTLEERREFCWFLKSMNFPDGYATNISGILLPTAIRKFLPKDMCGTIVEFCDFFKKLTSRTLYVADLEKMEKDIVFILCKMEQIFPPTFFDIMVHLAVHLLREAILVGPVSSRWMYPFERPEGSIAEGYVVNKVLTFSSLYISQIEIIFTRSERNKDVSQPIISTLSVFNQQERVMGSQQNHKLPLTLCKKAHWYVLNNCKEVDRYRK